MRGFAAIGLLRPKTPENVGGVLRAAGIYGASMVAIEGMRAPWVKHSTNTAKAHRHLPVLSVDHLLDARPYGAQVVVVDLIEGARPLPRFTHPEQAFYLFGPEDGTLGRRHTARAQHVVYVPGESCMNLAAAVNVVLYDRMVKRGEWANKNLELQGAGR